MGGALLKMNRSLPSDANGLASVKPKKFRHILVRLRSFFLLCLRRGRAVFGQCLIDLDADPFLPEGWKVESHQKGGMLAWSPRKVKLFFALQQKGDSHIEGSKLQEELARECVMNANLLDYLLANPELIPEEWRDKVVFFWGTIYRDSSNNLCVRDLCFCEGKWAWHCGWLKNVWRARSPAVVASS